MGRDIGYAPRDSSEAYVDRFLEHFFKHWKLDTGDRSARLNAMEPRGLKGLSLPLTSFCMPAIQILLFGNRTLARFALAIAT